MIALRQAFAAAYERLAARAGLLDRINVFPVADGDTGVNLRLSLAPLHDAKSPAALCRSLLQQGATGNSGNIAVAFFPPLLALAEDAGPEALLAACAAGSRLARGAVLAPQDGTMLDVMSGLAACSPEQSIPDILDRLAGAVRATAHMLPAMRQAGVVDAGALGLFCFFEGFFAAWSGDEGLLQAPGARFPGLLRARLPEAEAEPASCINLTLQGQADAALLATLGESVVVRRDGGLLHLHLHSHDPEATRAALQSVGEITAWHAESMQAATLPPEAGFVRLLCDAAGSLPRPLARQEGIVLLDSHVICGGISRPETLWDPAAIYAALRAGQRVSTAQASQNERRQHFQSALEQPGPVLYLAVGSVYTGNFAAAAAFQAGQGGQSFFAVDSGAASGRLAVIALMAARAARRLADMELLLAFVRKLCTVCEEYVCIADLRYLARSGRISRLSGLASGLLGIRPIISPEAEGVRRLALAHSQAAQRDFVLARLRALAKQGRPELLLLEYSDNEAWVREAMAPQIRAILPDSELQVAPLSLSSSVHMGPGTWALALCPKLGDW